MLVGYSWPNFRDKRYGPCSGWQVHKMWLKTRNSKRGFVGQQQEMRARANPGQSKMADLKPFMMLQFPCFQQQVYISLQGRSNLWKYIHKTQVGNSITCKYLQTVTHRKCNHHTEFLLASRRATATATERKRAFRQGNHLGKPKLLRGHLSPCYGIFQATKNSRMSNTIDPPQTRLTDNHPWRNDKMQLSFWCSCQLPKTSGVDLFYFYGKVTSRQHFADRTARLMALGG